LMVEEPGVEEKLSLDKCEIATFAMG